MGKARGRSGVCDGFEGLEEKLPAGPSRSPAMPHVLRDAAPVAGRASLYAEITERIIAELEAGRLPWVQPWGASVAAPSLGLPRNVTSGRTYSGINVLILWGAVFAGGF